MHTKKSVIVILLLSLTLGCNLLSGGATENPSPTQATTSQPPTAQPPASEKRCGDGICDGPENHSNCPEDCTQARAPGIPGDLPPGSALQPGEAANSYWINNPTSGARLFVQVLYPGDWSGESLPTLVLVPGGAGTIDPAKARRMVEQGFVVVFFDPDGRGKSEGQEDLDGYIHQDGLAAVIREATTIPGVDANRIGLVSFSYGVSMASGALARHIDLPVKFLIDWEGPADRQDTSVGCTPNQRIDFPDCSDDAAWAEREALTFIAHLRVPYQRLQSENDHVQPDVSHAIHMVNAAVQGGVPWVRLNDLPPDQTYDPANPPTMLPDKADATLEEMIARIAPELFSLAF
ncbi:MAG: hypothetical protein JXA78_02270 [Anaerolineales bacterium]|nr:hypothetical protein [Anaerolineales bacterium]